MAALVLLVPLASTLDAADREAPISYETHIKPLLRQHCLKCHGDDKQEADLNMQSYAGLLRGGGGGKIVEAGRSSQSLLVQAVANPDGDARMPPNSPPLAAEKIGLIRRWIDTGLRETATGPSLVASRDLAFAPPEGAGASPHGPPAMPRDLPAIAVPDVIRQPPVLALDASPRAPLLAVAAEGHVRLIHTETEQEIGRLAFPEGEPHVIRFSRDGAVLMAAGGRPVESGRVVLFDVSTGRRLAEIGDELDAVLAADLSPDQRLVALGGSGRAVKVYSTVDGKLLYKLTKHTDWITALGFSPDGARLASADRAGGIHLWDARSGGIVLNLSEHKSAVRALDWRGDSKLLVSAAEDGKLIWWDAADGFPAIIKANAHPPRRPSGSYGTIPNGVLAARFASNGYLSTGGRDQTIQVWSPAGDCLKSYRVDLGVPISTALAHDGAAVISGDSAGRVRFWKDVRFWDAAPAEDAPPAPAKSSSPPEKLAPEDAATPERAASAEAPAPAPSAAGSVQAELLVVGATESGCAAAVQAARMGVSRVVLVNDIEWLGGQFSAEGLGAIDENRAEGYDGTVPIPRSGIFLDVIDAIEAKNAERYGGIRRPGHTRVITTSRPVVAEQVFRELLAPFEASGQIKRYSNFRVQSVEKEGNRVIGVEFRATDGQPALSVRAKMTIDASDWGDVIKGAGAEWDAGLDSKSEFGEPSAPESGEPATDMNPITWCLILEQRKEKSLFPGPDGYDPKYFNGTWGWIDEEFAYTSRRLVDGQGFKEIDHPDILLINSPPIDYPLDVYPAGVAAALEAIEKGASKKSLAAMTPAQREVVFEDARRHSLKYYYHLQQRFPAFHHLALSDEFGTKDKLPPKPYVRESLRLVAQHVIREPEVLGFGGRSNYASTMFHDAVFCWQFELDFHPTKRSWTTDLGDQGPWEAAFRGKRRFGRGGTGRCVFPLRALTPRGVQGLLGAQKNLGYTSIVGSSCRLHDQSIHAGQASGAVAAVSLRHGESPSEFYLRPDRIAEVWAGLLEPPTGAPLVIWPFSDVAPSDPGFVAMQQLALRRLLPLGAYDTAFQPNEPAAPSWISDLTSTIREAGYAPPRITVTRTEKRRNIAVAAWNHIKSQPLPPTARKSEFDADGDGVADASDPLPFTVGAVSWKIEPARDGLPDREPPFGKGARAFNFTSAGGAEVAAFTNDSGAAYSEKRGFGWRRDLSANTRLRGRDGQLLRDGFVFTRQQDVWECRVEGGAWRVRACLGDSGHDQPGQHLSIEGQAVARGVATGAGHYHEVQANVNVSDGRLTLTLGVPEGGSNTCLNWVILEPAR